MKTNLLAAQKEKKELITFPGADCAGKRSLLLLSLSPPSGIKEEEAAAGCTFKERRRRRKKKEKERFGEEKKRTLRPERSHRGSQPGTGSLASNISCLAL